MATVDNNISNDIPEEISNEIPNEIKEDNNKKSIEYYKSFNLYNNL